MQGDIQSHCTGYEACQRRKTPHRRLPLPKCHIPVERSFQRVAIDLVEYKTVPWHCKYVMPVIGHLTRFVFSHPFAIKSSNHDCTCSCSWISFSLWCPKNVVFGPRYRVQELTCPRVSNIFLLQEKSYHTILATRQFSIRACS